MIRTLITKVIIYYHICPRSSDPFYIVSYYITWATSSWTHSTIIITLHLSRFILKIFVRFLLNRIWLEQYPNTVNFRSKSMSLKLRILFVKSAGWSSVSKYLPKGRQLLFIFLSLVQKYCCYTEEEKITFLFKKIFFFFFESATIFFAHYHINVIQLIRTIIAVNMSIICLFFCKKSDFFSFLNSFYFYYFLATIGEDGVSPLYASFA